MQPNCWLWISNSIMNLGGVVMRCILAIWCLVESPCRKDGWKKRNNFCSNLERQKDRPFSAALVRT